MKGFTEPVKQIEKHAADDVTSAIWDDADCEFITQEKRKILDFEKQLVAELKADIGQPLKYQEMLMHGPEYLADGTFCGPNRPHMIGCKRKFFAEVTMVDGLIHKVS